MLNESLSEKLIYEFLSLFEVMHAEIENVLFLKEALDLKQSQDARMIFGH